MIKTKYKKAMDVLNSEIEVRKYGYANSASDSETRERFLKEVAILLELKMKIKKEIGEW